MRGIIHALRLHEAPSDNDILLIQQGHPGPADLPRLSGEGAERHQSSPYERIITINAIASVTRSDDDRIRMILGLRDCRTVNFKRERFIVNGIELREFRARALHEAVARLDTYRHVGVRLRDRALQRSPRR